MNCQIQIYLHYITMRSHFSKKKIEIECVWWYDNIINEIFVLKFATVN